MCPGSVVQFIPVVSEARGGGVVREGLGWGRL